MSGLSITVLLSCGRHPASGRPRRNPDDARALALALALAKAEPGSRVLGIHAGDPSNPALRDYLGQGLEELVVLAMPKGADALAPLAEQLAQSPPDLLLSGLRAEDGEGSGLLPYQLAQILNIPLVPGIVAFELIDSGLCLTQGLPRGRRRRLAGVLPMALGVPAGTAALPLPAFAAAKRGRIVVHEVAAEPDALQAAVERKPWRQLPPPRPRRLGGSAIDRLKEMTGGGEAKGRLVVDPDPETAASLILDRLAEIGLFCASPSRIDPKEAGQQADRRDG